MKRSGIALLNACGAASAARTLQGRRVTILTYHGVIGGTSDYEYLNHNFISAESFDAQMRYVAEHYQPIALHELVRFYREGRTPPRRSLAVTFDDGFANNFTVAFPILRRHRVPFTVFVTTSLLDVRGELLWTDRAKRALYLCTRTSVVLPLDGIDVALDLSSPAARVNACRDVLGRMKRLPPAMRQAALQTVDGVCGRPPIEEHERERYEFLSWQQVKQMAEAGVEFGSHTVSHPILATLDSDALDMELTRSKQRIEAMLQRECYALAYPNGSPADFGVREKTALRQTGYLCGLSLKGTLNDRPDLFELDRVNVGRHLDMPSFQLAITGVLGTARRTRDWFARSVRSAVGKRRRAS